MHGNSREALVAVRGRDWTKGCWRAWAVKQGPGTVCWISESNRWREIVLLVEEAVGSRSVRETRRATAQQQRACSAEVG
jgi:hypothetical protein